MKSDRIYPVLVLVLVLLLAGSGVLAYVFYQMLANPAATPMDADAAAAAAGPGAPAGQSRLRQFLIGSQNGASSDLPTVGPDGSNAKWAPRKPATPPTGKGVGVTGWTPGTATPVPSAYMGMPLSYDDDCQDFGGEYSMMSDGAALSPVLGTGSACIDIQRPEIYVPEGETNTYTIDSVTYDSCELDRNLHMCFEVGELSPGDRGSSWHPLYAPTPRSSRSPATLLEEWHTPFLEDADHSENAQRNRKAEEEAPIADTSAGAANRNAYFRGNNPSAWFADLPPAASATYRDIQPGVDLDCYADQNRLEYVFTFWPGTDPQDIEFVHNQARGVHAIGQNNIAIDYEGATLIQHRPYAYKMVNDQPQEMFTTYALRGKTVALEMLDPKLPQTPTLAPIKARQEQPIVDYISYLGGSGDDRGFAIAVDNRGHAYLAGTATSSEFATGQGSGAPKTDTDIFVSKIRLSDRKVIYTTMLGGRHDDRAFDIAVDASGNAYVCGETTSPDFATVTPPPGGVLGRAWDAFVIKLTPDGAIGDFAFRLGGRGDDRAFGIAVDSATNVIVAGTTHSDDFPLTTGGAAGGKLGTSDGFIVKVAPSGKDLLYAVRCGGSGDDEIFGLALDPDGTAVVVGETTSTDWQTVAAFQAQHGGGTVDGFMVRLAPDGKTFNTVTYIGGKGEDRALGVDVDRAHTVFITGETASDDFPTKGAVQQTFAGGNWDAFLCRLDPIAVDHLVYATYLGGSGDDRGFAVAASVSGKPYVAGTTSSEDLPLIRPLQGTFGGGAWDAFVACLDETASQVNCITYLGGDEDDAIQGLAMESGRILHFSGVTQSRNLKVVEPLQSTHRGERDALIGRLLASPPPTPDMRPVPAGGMPGGPAYDFNISTFEIDNEQIVEFLNDAQANPDNARGTNVYFDAIGSAWMSPEMYAERDELFCIHCSRLVYDPNLPVGARFSVTPRPDQDGGTYLHHPASGMSWYGAVKYCNWLTVASGRSEAHLCYREGPHPEDWMPVTCPPESWARGEFTSRQRLAWLRYKGYRLPMDNCAAAPIRSPAYFRVSNDEFADFLNDAEANPDTERGANVWVDATGDVFAAPHGAAETNRLFSITRSLLSYDPSGAPGARFAVNEGEPGADPPNSKRPIANVTWLGAMKYCNWLTLLDGQKPEDRSYREGPLLEDWAPVSTSQEGWKNGEFTERERDRWARVAGFRLPLFSSAVASNAISKTEALVIPTNSWPNAFNEAYKSGGWGGATNVQYAVGRNTIDQRDANFLDNAGLARHDTTPVGHFNGTDHEGRFPTRTNENLYGIYDISGNVSEWLTDPGMKGSLVDRSYQGGSWRSTPVRVGERYYIHPFLTERSMGFRVLTMALSDQMHVARIPFRLCVAPYGVGPGCEQRRPGEQDDELEGGTNRTSTGTSGPFPLPTTRVIPKTTVPPPPTVPPPGGGGGGGGGGNPQIPPTTTVPAESDGDDGGGPGLVTICHRPPGNPGNAQTISVPLAAVPGHLGHGDSLGPCP